MKKFLICLVLLALFSGCKHEYYPVTPFIPEYEKFALRPGAQLIFRSETGMSDTFVVDSVNNYTEITNYGNDIEQVEKVSFKKNNTITPYNYSLKKYYKTMYTSEVCEVFLYFNQNIFSNNHPWYYTEKSILINYNINGRNYPYVDFIKNNKSEVFYNPPYGIIKYRLQDSIVWSLDKIIE